MVPKLQTNADGPYAYLKPMSHPKEQDSTSGMPLTRPMEVLKTLLPITGNWQTNASPWRLRIEIAAKAYDHLPWAKSIATPCGEVIQSTAVVAQIIAQVYDLSREGWR